MGLSSPTSRTITYDGIQAHALATWYFKQEGVIDNVFGPFTAWRETMKRIRTVNHPGGERGTFAVRLDLDAVDPSYSGYGSVDTTVPNMDSVAHFPFAEYFVPVGQSFQERDLVRGEQAIARDWVIKMEQAQQRMNYNQNIHWYGDGTGNSSQRYIGMAAWVDDAPTTGTVAGINRANVTGWRNQTITNSTVITLMADLTTLLTSCRQGYMGRGPDFAITNQVLRNQLEGRAQYTTTTATYTSYLTDVKSGDSGKPGTGRTADFGFGRCAYYGIPVMEDPDYTVWGGSGATEGEGVFLNSDSFRWINCIENPTVGGLLEFVDPERAIGQTAKVGGLRMHGQLVCVEPRTNGIILDVS